MCINYFGIIVITSGIDKAHQYVVYKMNKDYTLKLKFIFNIFYLFIHISLYNFFLVLIKLNVTSYIPNRNLRKNVLFNINQISQ